MKCSSKMLQNLLQSMYKKTHPGLFVFHYKQLYILPCECPGLCQFTLGHSKGENVKLHKMKYEKNYVGFLIDTQYFSNFGA